VAAYAVRVPPECTPAPIDQRATAGDACRMNVHPTGEPASVELLTSSLADVHDRLMPA
jgi:hypothetical protein